VDRVEAAERAASRQLALQRANKMLHDEGDRVKALHGRLLLSEVIAQNKALTAHKARVAGARKAQEAAFVEQQRRALEVCAQEACVNWAPGKVVCSCIETSIACTCQPSYWFDRTIASGRPLQAAEQVELAKLEDERARLRAQRDAQSQQLEEVKARILAERWEGDLGADCF
jgi:hypothetical protein